MDLKKLLKLNLRKIIVLVLIGFLLYIISNYFQTNYYSCVKDDDCILVLSSCCPCSASGTRTAINKNYVDEFDKERKSKCPKEFGCFTTIGCQENVDLRCIDNTCTMVPRIPDVLLSCDNVMISVLNVKYCDNRLSGKVNLDFKFDDMDFLKLALRNLIISIDGEEINIPINDTNGEKVVLKSENPFSFDFQIPEDFDKIKITTDCDNVYAEKNKVEIEFC